MFGDSKYLERLFMALSHFDYVKKLNPLLYKSLDSATSFCKLRGHPYVELVHWLHHIHSSQGNDYHKVLSRFGIKFDDLGEHILGAILKIPSGSGSVQDFSNQIIDLIRHAWMIATLKYSDHRIRSIYLLLAWLNTPDLRSSLFQISQEFKKIDVQELESLVPSILLGSTEEHSSSFDGVDLNVQDQDSQPSQHDLSKQSSLKSYCVDMTANARSGLIDPVIGRHEEIKGMIDILLRRRQNNPLLVGEAGVGKTAVVEGLALSIAEGNVPPLLKNSRVLCLDMGALLAGASVKGEFESRLKSVVDEIGKSKVNTILFIDEIHTLVGAGGAQGTGDAANLLKPALARGGLKTIGATTYTEYKKYIEKDPALTRRFQVLDIKEPKEDVAIEMLRGLVKQFSDHHQVIVLDEAIKTAVHLSSRYITSRQLPDKAISLLDTACSRVALSLHTTPSAIEYLQHRKESLSLELSLLAQEKKINPEVVVMIPELKEKLVQVNTQLIAAEERWIKEQSLTQELLALRQDENSSTEDMHRIESQLEELQKDFSYVHAEVDAGVVASVVADWTGIPVGKMLKDEMHAVLNLADHLSERVVGQGHALHTISRYIRTARAGLANPNKPIGVFLLVGPSGVGKTETALALADSLYGGEHHLITINMSEFQESHTVSTLKGAPPGYVGYGEGGVLTEAVRRRPYSVILLDEIEKAHRDIHEIFYQVFDKGWMEDGEGRYIDFKNTVIIMTSNAASDIINEHVPHDILHQALLSYFPAAFLGRISVVPYNPLSEKVLKDIVGIQIHQIQCRLMEQHGIVLTYEDEVIDHIVNECSIAETGARLIVHYLEQNILPELSKVWLDHWTSDRHISLINMAKKEENIAYQIKFA
jgi:type VI secretion system protein VasG